MIIQTGHFPPNTCRHCTKDGSKLAKTVNPGELTFAWVDVA